MSQIFSSVAASAPVCLQSSIRLVFLNPRRSLEGPTPRLSPRLSPPVPFCAQSLIFGLEINPFGTSRDQRASICTRAMESIAFIDLLRSEPRIILGSKSASRRQLMDELLQEAWNGVGGTSMQPAYDVVTADIDEKSIRHRDPETLVMQLAHAKADAIIAKMKASRSEEDRTLNGMLITCDQVVVHENRILEKPESLEEARSFIEGYGRSPAQTIGSVVCTDLRSGRRFNAIDRATIHFETIPKTTIDSLLKEGDVMWCAGGLMVEHPLVQPHVVKIDGGIDAVMGLGKSTVADLLCQAAQGTDC